MLIIGLTKRPKRCGQSTTELAIIGTIILTVFALLLQYGQTMNKQQAVRMQTFRQTLGQAYENYDDGRGFGGATYAANENVHIASPFTNYYDGGQRQSVGSHAVVLWDPDLMYVQEDDDGPNSYMLVNGELVNLGQRSREDMTTGVETEFLGGEEEYRVTSTGIKSVVRADVNERLITTIKLNDGTEEIIEQNNIYSTDETWITPWP